jgi:hypothetical protein
MTESPFIVLVLILAVAGLFASTLAVADEECFFEHDGNLVLYRPIDDMEILEVRLADRPNQVVVVRDSDGDALLRSKDDLIFRRHLEPEERETGRLQPFQTSPAEPPLHGFEGPGLTEIVDICREEGGDSPICKRLKAELAILQDDYGTPLLLLKDLAEKGLGEYLEVARTTLQDGHCAPPPPEEAADGSETPQEEG